MHSIALIICCLYKCAYQLNWHAHHVVTSDAAPKTSASTIITAIMHDTAVWKTSAAADDASALETRHAGLVLHVCMTCSTSPAWRVSRAEASSAAAEVFQTTLQPMPLKAVLCVCCIPLISLPLSFFRHVSELCPELCSFCNLFGSIECSADRSTRFYNSVCCCQY